MILSNLENTYNVLITHMKNNNYSQRYISLVNYEIKALLKNGRKCKSYLDYYETFIKSTEKAGKRKYRLDTLNLIMNFDIYKIFPSRYQLKHKIIDNSNYTKLNKAFKEVIDVHYIISKNNGKKENTTHNEALRGASFFIYLQNIGKCNFEDVTENDVLNFFVDENNKLIKSYSYKKQIRAVLKSASTQIKECEKILNYLPILKQNRKNINFLKSYEIQKIKDVLNSKSLEIDYRTKAIVTLLLYTGLRGCDIASLKLTDIDWENEIITIIQNKTDNELQLPLLPVIGNILFEYITKERPKSNIQNIFIRKDSDLPITKSSVDIAVCKVMDMAQIRMEKGARRGTHIFRYHLATFLLQQNIPQPIITQTLGHSLPSSLDPYLHADFVHLKECSLSVEKFSKMEVQQ